MTKGKIKKILIFFVCVLILLGVFPMFVGKDTIYVKTYESLLERKSESYTELYFDSYSSLPKSLSESQNLNFNFTIHNKEGVATTYSYVVYFEDVNGGITKISSGDAIVANESFRKINIKFAFSGSVQSGRVVVELTNKNQKIYFLIPRNN